MTITKLKTKKFALSLSLLFFLSLGLLSLSQNISSAQATSLWDQQINSGIDTEIGIKAFGETNTPQDIRVTMAKVIKVFLGLLGLIFLIMIIWAGFKWMTSGGNEEQVKEAQSQMLRAFIGLAIILASWGITEMVTTCLLTASGAVNNIWYCPN